MFFFVVAVSCDSFYIISKCFMFVNNFFKLFFCRSFIVISDNLYILSCVFHFVNTFFEVFYFYFSGDYLASLITNKNPPLFRDGFL